MTPLPDLATWIEEAREQDEAYPDETWAEAPIQARRVLALAAALEELRAGVTKVVAEWRAEADDVEQDGTSEAEVEQFVLRSVSAQLAALLGESS